MVISTKEYDECLAKYGREIADQEAFWLRVSKGFGAAGDAMHYDWNRILAAATDRGCQGVFVADTKVNPHLLGMWTGLPRAQAWICDGLAILTPSGYAEAKTLQNASEDTLRAFVDKLAVLEDILGDLEVQ